MATTYNLNQKFIGTVATRTFYNLSPARFTTCHLLQEATFTQNNPHREITDNQNNYTT
jgi:hypothetical protein